MAEEINNRTQETEENAVSFRIVDGELTGKRYCSGICCDYSAAIPDMIKVAEWFPDKCQGFADGRME